MIKLVGLVIALTKGEMTALLRDISHSCQAVRAGGQFYLHLGQGGPMLIRCSEMTAVCHLFVELPIPGLCWTTGRIFSNGVQKCSVLKLHENIFSFYT